MVLFSQEPCRICSSGLPSSLLDMVNMTKLNMCVKFRNCKFVVVFIFIVSLFSAPVYAEVINGEVLDQEGNPIPDADILVIDHGKIRESTQSDIFGRFNVNVSENATSLIVYGDLESSLGVDYVPARVSIKPENQITLIDGASLTVKGGVQFVDTENLPMSTYFSILDENENVLVPMGVPLIYNTKNSIFKEIPSYNEHLIVPADSGIKIRINATTLIRSSKVMETSLVTDKIQTMSKGGIFQLDISYYTYPLNRERTLSSLNELSTYLKEVGGYSFYLEKQEVALSESMSLFDEAGSLRSLGKSSEAFDALRRSYIISSHTIQEVSNMFQDAQLSTNILIGFLALSSLSLGYLLVEGTLKQIVATVGVYLGSELIFYYIYPGSRIISVSQFVWYSVGYLVLFGLLGYFLPKMLETRSWDERVHTRNLLEPIFSIAKRSLRNRRLRFLLTLVSLTLLVMSFVTLTSFSESYGLIVTEKMVDSEWNGVYFHGQSWSEEDPSFFNLNNVEEQWLLDMPEVTAISVKAENIPLNIPLFRMGRNPIKGILGISDEEGSIINPTIHVGNIPDDDGVMLSNALAESLNLTMGDVVDILGFELTVQGLVDDSEFGRLIDLDGTKYLPNKWVNINPPGEPERLILEPCETTEIIILSVDNAIKNPTTGIQRLGLELNNVSEGFDIATRLALERGYQSTAVFPSERVSFSLGNYFEGRGFSLVVPWGIVVLNVVITMMNSMFERKSEIEILSSVGLNPTQVSSVFLAESMITGFIAGGLGYLMGLSIYKILAVLNIGLQVNQKISSIWIIASIALSISAVLSGAFIALRNSVVITPSLLRKWKVVSKTDLADPYEMIIPMKLSGDKVFLYRDYILTELRARRNHPENITSVVKCTEIENGWVISFNYKSVSTVTGNFYTSNKLYITLSEDGEYRVKLFSRGEKEWAHVVGTLIRLFSIDFSTNKDK